MTGLPSSTTAFWKNKRNLKASPWGPACRSIVANGEYKGKVEAPCGPACRSIVAWTDYKSKVAVRSILAKTDYKSK